MGAYGGGWTPAGTPHYSGLAQYGYYNASRYMSKLDRQKALAILGLLSLVLLIPTTAPTAGGIATGATVAATGGRVAGSTRFAAATRASSVGVASSEAMVLRANTLPVVSASTSYMGRMLVSGPLATRVIPAGIIWKGMMELAHLDSGIFWQATHDPAHNLLGLSRSERGGAREFRRKKSVALGARSSATRYAQRTSA